MDEYNAVEFTLIIEIPADQREAMTLALSKEILNELEEVLHKRGFSIYDQAFNWIQV